MLLLRLFNRRLALSRLRCLINRISGVWKWKWGLFRVRLRRRRCRFLGLSLSCRSRSRLSWLTLSCRSRCRLGLLRFSNGSLTSGRRFYLSFSNRIDSFCSLFIICLKSKRILALNLTHGRNNRGALTEARLGSQDFFINLTLEFFLRSNLYFFLYLDNRVSFGGRNFR